MRKKILHIITRLDMGGSAQNTLLACKELSGKFEIILVHGLSHEPGMIDLEKQMVEDGVEKTQTHGVKFIPLSSLVRGIRLIKNFKALLSLVWLMFKKNFALPRMQLNNYYRSQDLAMSGYKIRL